LIQKTLKLFINFIPTAIYDPEFCLSTTEKWAKQLDFDPAQIVFEVVETEDELKMIKSIGVDYAQGYYFAKPSSEPLRKIASL